MVNKTLTFCERWISERIETEKLWTISYPEFSLINPQLEKAFDAVNLLFTI